VSGGDNGVLEIFDVRGQRMHAVEDGFVGHESDVLAVATSPDGRYLVSGSDDQTVRLWNLASRELIVTLFQGSDGEWVMWTPQGYYTGSPGAEKMVGWQISNGPDKTPEYVGAEQLRYHLNRPDIVERAIVLASATQAAREGPGTTFQRSDLLSRSVPRFRVAAPASGVIRHGGRALVKITIEATPDPVKTIQVQVNGRHVEEKSAGLDSGGFGAGEQSLDVPLSSGHNEVRVELTNAMGTKSETVTLIQEGEGLLDRRGALYILAVGVDEYKGLGNVCGISGNENCDLKYSGADARALVAAVEERVGPGHTNVVKRVLVNDAPDPKDAPTAANILDATDMLRQAKATDTIVVFIAGHGINEGPDYRFLATNAERAHETFRSSTVVQWQVLQAAIEGAKGRRILFVDTCHSGNAYNQRLGNTAYHANVIVYTATRFDQEALEDETLGHGLFTYAVVEGLRQGFEAQRAISTKALADYVVKRVGQMAAQFSHSQEPQYFKGRDADDYVLAQ
jgi:hypothetical protein